MRKEQDMSQIIAGMYEIQNRIGAGGGGVVYLGSHLRLKKPVVLKADKRTLSAETEALRREVDMLKQLSHTYIPQVYDFVQEDGVVYTVMDFIDGESLDKLLGRNQIPPQPQVIRWACQLLEALDYLHSRPPYGILHGDIKPANIMLKPDGDICLIDFNIALALGEDGAVKVGFSRGYASPEHYGMDYIGRNKSAAAGRIAGNRYGNGRSGDEAETLLLGRQGTGPDSRRTAGGTKAILLDARSDIYSLGATLYHLLSGRRPAQDATEVEPLGADVCSAEVSDILQKAMAPNPDMRYQSAEEMLNAFLQLHKRDRRVRRHKRRAAASAAVLTAMFLTGGFAAFVGLKQLEQRQGALTLAEYSADALSMGDVEGAVRLALQAIPSGNSIWEADVTPQAQKALTDALGVYDLEDGFRAAGTIELPSAPFKLAVSPDGSYLAAVYAYETAVFDMDSRKEAAVLPTQESALADAVFMDEGHLIYAGAEGITAYDVDEKKVLWTGETATALALSADHGRVAAVNRMENHVTVYRTSDGKKEAERSFGNLHMQVAVNDTFANPEDSVFALNEDGSLLAVSFHNGGLYIFDLEHPDGDMVIYEESDYRHFEGGFYGNYFAYCAGDTKAQFGLVDCTEGRYLGGYEAQDKLLLQADGEGIYLADGNLLAALSPETMEEKELAYTDGLYITAFAVWNGYALAATNDNGFSFYDSGAHFLSGESGNENSDFTVMAGGYAVVGNRNEPTLRLLKLESHEEAQLLAYDADYRHEEARISQDGRTAVLFSVQGFRVYDMDGRMLAEKELPEAGSIYDQQFIRSGEGSWLEVVWYDGTVRRYDAADGSLVSERVESPPAKDLYEEFYTDKYRIASSLHTAPEVYEIDSGKQAAVLEEDSYLTYVTQMGEYLITEYVSAAGERYGILLDRNLQKLAYLPGLCDVTGGMLVFDYGTGNLRQCRLYSLRELTALGETYGIDAVNGTR